MGNVFEFLRESGEIIENTESASMVVGFATSQKDADEQIAAFRAKDETTSTT